MILGLMADVHCNAEAMKRALAAMEPVVDDVLLAGDAVLQYRFSNEVIELVREHDITYVAGNHELTLGSPAGSRALNVPTVRSRNVELMTSAPTRHDRVASGKRVVMVHGNWQPPFDGYLYPHSPALAACADLDADILILGHTHLPMAARVGDVLVVNPGSLGQGGDPAHPGELSYALLDTDSEEVTIHRLPRDPL